MIISRADTRRSVLHSLFSSCSVGKCHHPEVSDFPEDEVSGPASPRCNDLSRYQSQPTRAHYEGCRPWVVITPRSRPIILSPLVRLETRQRHIIRGGHDTIIRPPGATCDISLSRSNSYLTLFSVMNAVTGCVCQAMAESRDRNLAADSVKKHYVLICLPGQGVIRLSPDLGTTYQYRGEG